MTTPALDIDLREIEQFIYREARMADASDYDAWEALWTDDAQYWVPVDGASDPGDHVSVIFDNRSRLHTRLQQLRTGKRYAQLPMSRVARVISNIEVTDVDGADTRVAASFVLAESRVGNIEWWAGHLEYRIRREDGELRLVGKKVVLINNDEPIPTVSFLI